MARMTMASSSTRRCLNCLLHVPPRPLFAPSSSTVLLQQSSSFSTTPALSFAAPARPAPRIPSPNQTPNRTRITPGTHKVKHTPTINKKTTAAKAGGRPLNPGERKAVRKRIVLSNVNALEVPGLEDLSAENMLDEEMKGKVVGIPGPVVDQLRAVGAFKPRQHWGMFRRPAMLLRDEAVELGRKMDAIGQTDDGKEPQTVRAVLTGARGTGKSLIMLQAMTMAFLKGWVVLHIPEGSSSPFTSPTVQPSDPHSPPTAQELTNATTDYSPLASSSPDTPTTYAQPTYLSALLSTLLASNTPLLTSLTLHHTHDLPIPLLPDTSLHRLAIIGARDPDLAHPVFLALWRELTALTRPPILLAADNIAHLYRLSAYRSSTFAPIHAHDLALVDHFVSHLSGASPLPNGGVVLGATSDSNNIRAPTFERLLDGDAAQGLTPERDPKQRHLLEVDGRVEQAMQGVDVWRIGGLKREELGGWLEYAARSGVVRGRVTEGGEGGVGEWWGMSGGGVVGEVVRGMAGMRL